MTNKIVDKSVKFGGDTVGRKRSEGANNFLIQMSFSRKKNLIKYNFKMNTFLAISVTPFLFKILCNFLTFQNVSAIGYVI